MQGCWGGAWAPLLLSSADMPRRAALLFGEVLGPCRHARSSTQAWGQCPWPAVSPEPSGLPEHCLIVVTRMKEQPRGRHQRRTLKTPATRTTRTGRSAGRRVSWCLCIGRRVLETPAHQDQHGGVASTGPTGPRAEGPWVPVSKPTLLASPPAQVFSASTARLGSSGQSMWPSCHQRKERAGNIAALVD